MEPTIKIEANPNYKDFEVGKSFIAKGIKEFPENEYNKSFSMNLTIMESNKDRVVLSIPSNNLDEILNCLMYVGRLYGDNCRVSIPNPNGEILYIPFSKEKGRDGIEYISK